MISRHRTEAQKARIAAAESVGYVHHRDSDYRLKIRRGAVLHGCLCVLFGNVTGSDRAMIVYPDGSVITQAANPRNNSVTFNRTKLAEAIRKANE